MKRGKREGAATKRDESFVRAEPIPAEHVNVFLAAAHLVCPHCAGNTPPYFAAPSGPNEAGNYVHRAKAAQHMDVLCAAGGIYAHLRFCGAWKAAS